MPGSISDSYDPEWGTLSNGAEIVCAIDNVYEKISNVLGGKPPIYILELVNMDNGRIITASLTEKEWRILRFTCERAKESI